MLENVPETQWPGAGCGFLPRRLDVGETSCLASDVAKRRASPGNTELRVEWWTERHMIRCASAAEDMRIAESDILLLVLAPRQFCDTCSLCQHDRYGRLRPHDMRDHVSREVFIQMSAKQISRSRAQVKKSADVRTFDTFLQRRPTNRSHPRDAGL